MGGSGRERPCRGAGGGDPQGCESWRPSRTPAPALEAVPALHLRASREQAPGGTGAGVPGLWAAHAARPAVCVSGPLCRRICPSTPIRYARPGRRPSRGCLRRGGKRICASPPGRQRPRGPAARLERIASQTGDCGRPCSRWVYGADILFPGYPPATALPTAPWHVNVTRALSCAGRPRGSRPRGWVPLRRRRRAWRAAVRPCPRPPWRG